MPSEACVTSVRSQERGGEMKRIWFIYHFYSLAVEADFYGDTGRVIGFFTKLSNGDRG